MSTNQQKLLTNIRKNRIKRRRFLMLLSILSIFIFTGVVWELRMEGISLTDDVRCEIEAHEHWEGCYADRLICEDADIGHLHDENCYEKTLVCETEEHVHTMNCYIEEEASEGEEPSVEKEAGTGEDPTATLPESSEWEEDTESEEVADGESEEEQDPFAGEAEEEDPWANMTEEEIREWLLANGMGIMAMADPDATNAPNNKHTFYIITTLGERDMNRVHEYLAGIGLGTNVDGYVPNIKEHDKAYRLHVGDKINLCVYGDPSAVDSKGSKYYMWRSDGSDKITIGTPTESLNPLLPDESGETITADGYRRLVRTITAVEPGYATVSYNEYGDNSGERLDFYIEIVENEVDGSPATYTHSDIEVVDGGTYTITEESTLENGTTVKITTEYRTIITGVNKCTIYAKNGNILRVFTEDDYEESGTPGETQYELTSAWKCMFNSAKHFSQADTGKVEFDTRILLRPLSRQTYVNGSLTKDEQNLNEDDIYIQNAIFSPDHLNITSVIDANNKCPNHTGLDFTVKDDLNLYFTIPPASVEFKTSKKVIGGDIPEGQFEFELVDRKGVVVATAKNNADGSIVFPKQYYLSDNTYQYTIREKIPAEAIPLEDGSLYYNGYIYDTSQRMVSVQVVLSEDGRALIPLGQTYVEPFENEKYDLDTTEPIYRDLMVSKKWLDSDSSHAPIRFKVYQMAGGRDDLYVAPDGASEFTLDDSNNWTMTFPNLRVFDGHSTYIYKVVETAIPSGYTPEYTTSSDGMSITIHNKKNDVPLTLRVEKKWVDENGQPLANPPVDSVHVTLRRQSREIKVPIIIQIQDTNGNQKDTHIEYAYVGSSLTLNISTDESVNEGKLRFAKIINATTENGNVGTKNCSAVIPAQNEDNDLTVNVSNVQNGAEILIQMDEELIRASNGGVFYLQKFEDETLNGVAAGQLPSGWANRGSSTVSIQSNYGEMSVQCLEISGRTATWHGVEYANASLFQPGKTYSIAVYGTYHDSSLANPVPIGMGCYYVDQQNGNHWDSIAVNTPISGNAWAKLINNNYTFPQGDIRNIYFQTDDTRRISIDNFIVAKAGTEPASHWNGDEGQWYVRNDAPNYKYDVSSVTNSEEIRNKATRWLPDTVNGYEWSKEIDLTAAQGWGQTLQLGSLNEEANKEYRYFVVETPVEGYTVSYSGDYVAFTNNSEPVTVTNRQQAYRLPDTGGCGTMRIRFSGLITLLCTGGAGVYIKRRKRRSSA